MKRKIAMTYIVRNYKHVFSCGYCDLYEIMRLIEPVYYNSGAYGWNCDIYVSWRHDIAITTGYRNTRGKWIPSELINKYKELAKSIIESYKFSDFNTELKALDEMRENFYQELLTL